jgi:hypothetical protein
MIESVRSGALAIVLAGSVCVGPLVAEQAAAADCKAVHADLIENAATTECRPPHTSCFLGEVDGNHGLRGTTYFKGDSAGSPPATSPEFRAYSGVFEYTTPRGTLIARESGAVSSIQGVVTAYQKITDATGEFAGVTGHFFVNGFMGGGRVVTQVTGQLCYP